MKKTYKNIIIVVSILLLGFVTFNFQQLFIIPKYRSPIIDNMIDPTSVLFKNEKIHGEFLCGEFNSKNRMGAYTGFNRFISNPDKALWGKDELKSDVNYGSGWRKLLGWTSALAEMKFEMAIIEALGKDKESRDQYYLVGDEYRTKIDAKQFANIKEWEEAKSTFKQTQFTILWGSICK